MFGFTRTVDLTTHDGHREILLYAHQILLNGVQKSLGIKAMPSAPGTADNAYTTLAQT